MAKFKVVWVSGPEHDRSEHSTVLEAEDVAGAADDWEDVYEIRGDELIKIEKVTE